MKDSTEQNTSTKQTRIRASSRKSELVKRKEAELRDARLMDKLLKYVSKMSDWGRGMLIDEIQSKWPIQLALPSIKQNEPSTETTQGAYTITQQQAQERAA